MRRNDFMLYSDKAEYEAVQGRISKLRPDRWPWIAREYGEGDQMPPWGARITGGDTNYHVAIACLDWLSKQQVSLLPECGNCPVRIGYMDERIRDERDAAKRARIIETLGVISSVAHNDINFLSSDLENLNMAVIRKARGDVIVAFKNYRESQAEGQVRSIAPQVSLAKPIKTKRRGSDPDGNACKLSRKILCHRWLRV